MTELVWEGKYVEGKRTGPVRIALPLQTIETVNETAQERQRSLDFFSIGQHTGWRNQLIWGDKKYVLPSLLADFAGKIKLIYIDPPFDTGADFSFTATIPADPDDSDEDTKSFVKEPSILEQKAYRDTWGRGLDSYLQWFYDTAILLKELLADDGSIFVHLDWHVNAYIRPVMDEVFGADNFRNDIIVKRRITKNLQRQFERIEALPWAHDTLYWYSRSRETRFRPLLVPYETSKPEGYWHHFWSNADRPTMRYKLLGVTPKNGQWKWKEDRALQAVANYERYLKKGQGLALAAYWEKTGKQLEFIRLSAKGKVENWFPPSEDRLGDTIWFDIHAYENEKQFPTQKSTELLGRIIETWSAPDDLVMDCFVGSGTTAVVAESLGRRWIGCDLSRFAIHTTRKRLLSVQSLRPFVVQNLGKYERQAWQAAEFQSLRGAMDREKNYRHFLLNLYHATPVAGYAWLHGVKHGRMIHVGAVDAPVTLADVKAIATEAWRSIGSGKGAPERAAVDILGWEFAFELNELARQIAAEAKIEVSFKKIPSEVLERRAVEQGDIRFFELAALDVKTRVKGRQVQIELTDFVISPDDIPEEVRATIGHWTQYIDYWAIDWNFRDDTFHNEWQAYRTKVSPILLTKADHTYETAGKYALLVKVIDILGNDTTKALEISII